MKNNNNTQALDSLCEFLVENILSATDEEILQEAAEDYANPDEISASVQFSIGKARLNVERQKLTVIKQEQGHAIAARTNLTDYDDNKIKLIFEQFSLKYNDDKKISIAARKGTDLTVQDMRSMLDDFQDLGYNLDSFTNGDQK